MKKPYVFAACASFLCLMAGTEPAAAPEIRQTAPQHAEFQRKLDDFIQRLRATPNAPPGTAVVVVHGGKTVFEHAYGMRDTRTGAALTLDTPMYNGSVTKAYTGVLAAILDAEGVLPLSSSLRDVWSGLTLPAPLDANAITAERLLSHSAEIEAGGLQFRSVHTGDVEARDVPGHLARYAEAGSPGFEYQNLGPFIWSAMAEARTGKPWSILLKERVLSPLGLERSSTILEDFDPDGVALCHPRTGGAWQAAPPKPTPVLNAAGGMYASPRDEADFLKAMITDGASAAGAIPAEILRRSWQVSAEQDRTMWGLRRDGYGLGWDLGTIGEHRFVARSGGYPGCRSISMFLPAFDMGIVLMSNGDAAVNTYHANILMQAADFWTNHPEAEIRATERLAQTQAVMAQAVTQADTPDPRLASARPIAPASWQSALGNYRNERLGDVEISLNDDQLQVQAGLLSGQLHHLDRDSFLILTYLGTVVETFDFIRDANDRIIGFVWDDDRYDRIRN